MENILSQESEAYENLDPNDKNKITGEKSTAELLKLSRNFQDIKELLLIYEKQVVKWAAETKLFLLTKNDILEIKQFAIDQGLPIEDFTQTLDEISKRTFFFTS